MRVIAGKYKSLEIEVPRGNDVRPTTDRVREAMFSSLQSIYEDLTKAVVLDAFAGSGALGIEALSRGAKYVIFCEKDRRSMKNLTHNLEKMHIERSDFSLNNIDSTSPVLRSCTELELTKISKNCINVVFFDPPYKMPSEVVLDIILNIHDLLSNDAVIVYEHSAVFGVD